MPASVVTNSSFSIPPSLLSPSASLEQLFDAIKRGQFEVVRQLLASDKSLTKQRRKGDYKYEAEVELDAYKFLGAYLGSLTPLQYAILIGQDALCKDIIDASFEDDLDVTFGGGNTALHLATLLGARDVVKQLVERGANKSIKNVKGFRPIDVADDGEMSLLFE